MTTEAERNALLKTFPPCHCGSVDKYGDDIGEHDPQCGYHLAAVAAFGVTVVATEPVEVIHCDECGAWGGGVEVHLVTCSKREEVATPVADWQRGHWMQTITGRAFYPMSPRVEDIDPTDVAHALGMQCRYNGHVKRFYSVAEHCVLMSDWALANLGETDRGARELALAALLHDAPEAYIGDMVRPLKLHMPAFLAIDDELVALVYRRFGLAFETIPTEVAVIDTRILLDEREALLAAPPQQWGLGNLEPLGVKVKCWAPETAKREYLARLRELAGVEA